MMAHNKNANFTPSNNVHNRIWEYVQRVCSLAILGLRHNFRVRGQINCCAIELFQKSTCDHPACFLEVVVASLFKICFYRGMKLKAHRLSLARSLLMASSPATGATEPEANSDSRRSASARHSASTSASSSRLMIKRSSK